MSNLLRGSGILGNPSPIDVTYMVRVARERDYGDRVSYLTATIDLFATTKEGQKIFESFHIITVPDERLDDSLNLRRQLRQLLKTDLERLVRSVRPRDS